MYIRILARRALKLRFADATQVHGTPVRTLATACALPSSNLVRKAYTRPDEHDRPRNTVSLVTRHVIYDVELGSSQVQPQSVPSPQASSSKAQTNGLNYVAPAAAAAHSTLKGTGPVQTTRTILETSAVSPGQYMRLSSLARERDCIVDPNVQVVEWTTRSVKGVVWNEVWRAASQTESKGEGTGSEGRWVRDPVDVQGGGQEVEIRLDSRYAPLTRQELTECAVDVVKHDGARFAWQRKRSVGTKGHKRVETRG